MPIRFDNIKLLLTVLSVWVRMEEATLLMTNDSDGKEKLKPTGIETLLKCLHKK